MCPFLCPKSRERCVKDSVKDRDRDQKLLLHGHLRHFRAMGAPPDGHCGGNGKTIGQAYRR